jgi:BASS family bile acid:Na+ symporter
MINDKMTLMKKDARLKTLASRLWSDFMNMLQLFIRILSKYMPIWILIFSVIAFLWPHYFLLLKNLTGVFLGVIFFLMGMTLQTESIKLVLRQPKQVFYGIAIKWVVTVSIAVIIAYIFFSGNPELATGIILSGSVPGGTSSNVYTLVANGAVAFSIGMAALDTLIGPLLTPAVTRTFAGQFIPIAFWPMFFSIIFIVFVPLAAGLLVKWKFDKKIEKVRAYTPAISMVVLLLIILSIVSNAQKAITENISLLPILFIAVFIQVVLQMALGYSIPKLLKFPDGNSRALLFYTGICNTALSATLAMNHVSSVAAVPSVINTIINLSLGAFIANMFAMRTTQKVTVQV